MAETVPVDAALTDAALLLIEWSDGARLHYPAHLLRAHCPCAHCVEEVKAKEDGPPHLDPKLFASVSFTSVEEVGTYALQIGFSDGHALGIYPFGKLRELGFPVGQAPRPEGDAAPFEV